MCNCIENINKDLAARSVSVSLCFETHDAEDAGPQRPVLRYGHRPLKPALFVNVGFYTANFCPFCGEKYPEPCEEEA